MKPAQSINMPLLWTLAALLAFILLMLNAWFGNLNQDEGWYLYAAGQVADGQLPYRDFAFTQGPIMPIVFSLFQPIIDQWGIFGGRIINALFGLAAILLASVVAYRMAPERWEGCAMLSCFILGAVNVYQSYFFAVVKTYSICAFFLLLGVLFFLRIARQPAPIAAVCAGIFLACATATRISAGLSMPIIGLYLLMRRKHLGHANWLAFCISGGLALILLFLPFFLTAHEGFLFGIFEYHTLREGEPGLKSLILKAGFLSRLVQAYFPAILIIISCLLARMAFRSNFAEMKGIVKRYPGLGVIVFLLLGITSLHLSAPFPYDDYQTFLYPLFCVLTSVLLTQTIFLFPQIKTVFLYAFLLLSVAFAFSSPINQEWLVIGRDRIWWKMKKQSDIASLRQQATTLREWSGKDRRLLTQDIYLAVEAGMKVPEGLEMGVFSYYPDMETTRAKKLKLINQELLLVMLKATDCPVAAFSEYSLSISCPQVTELSAEHVAKLKRSLYQRYDLITTTPHFGQGHTELRLFKLR